MTAMDVNNMTTKQDCSVLTQLLQELSWEGRKIKAYREGGRGFENVLTAEALQAIDFLPRSQFLGNVLREAHEGNAGRTLLADEAEQCEIQLLPGNFYLRPSKKSQSEAVAVQPDGIIKSRSVLCLLEAKRIKTNQFSVDQLAREYLLVTRDCGDRQPLLLLILSKPPPIHVASHGHKSIADAIQLRLAEVYAKVENHPLSLEQLSARIEDSYAWTTWGEMAQVVSEQVKTFEGKPGSLEQSVLRLANSFLDAVKRHG